MNDLLNCPFCGGTEFKYSVGHVNNVNKIEGTWVMAASIECSNCHTKKDQMKLFRSSSYEKAKQEALNQVKREWNQRVHFDDRRVQ